MKHSLWKDACLFGMEILHLSLYWLAVRTPLNNKIWIFGAWFGESYNDNSRYFYEYVTKNNPDINAVWLSRNKNVVKSLKEKGLKAYYFYDPVGIWYALRAGVAVFCVGYTADLPGFCITGRKKLIQLWHGSPLKKVGVQNTRPKDTNQRIFPYIQNKILLKFIFRIYKKLFSSSVIHISHFIYKLELYQLYTYVVSLSPVTKKTMIDAFNIPEDQTEKVIITGFPRDDVFFNKAYKLSNSAKKITDKIGDIHRSGGSVGFYLPTHRQEGEENMLKTIIENLKPNLKLLETEKIFLLIKLHQFHQSESNTEEMRNVIFVTEQDLDGDVYPLLPLTDFLVTDYSSIYFDYLLLDKPIIFLNYDLKKYINLERGLYYNYRQIAAGAKVESWKHLIPAIRKQLKTDSFKNKRVQVKKLIHTYTTGDSSKRIAEKIYSEFVV